MYWKRLQYGRTSDDGRPRGGQLNAWYTGTDSAIVDSFNVASVTNNAANDLTLTFSRALVASNYAVVGTGRGTAAFNAPEASIYPMVQEGAFPTSTSLRLAMIDANAGTSVLNTPLVHVGILGRA